MANDPIIQCFKEEFDRFHDLLVKQMPLFPTELWTRKSGGYPVWQQYFHTMFCIELYAMPASGAPLRHPFDREVALLVKIPETSMSVEEMLELSETMKALAHSYMDGLSADDLAKPHLKLSQLLGGVKTHQNALIGLVRHHCYHLGCCDSILRDNGIPGAY